MKTTGHTVLITGGATGIGLALATRFHAAGFRPGWSIGSCARILLTELHLSGTKVLH